MSKQDSTDSQMGTEMHDQEIRGQVMIVEDNQVNQRVLECMLVHQGFEVRLANNGQEAIDLAQQQEFDLIFMDCQMPVMDGYVATENLKAMMRNGEIKSTPIIAVTANILQSDQQRCYDSGMDDFMAKPVRMHQLEEVTNSWLKTG